MNAKEDESMTIHSQIPQTTVTKAALTVFHAASSLSLLFAMTMAAYIGTIRHPGGDALYMGQETYRVAVENIYLLLLLSFVACAGMSVFAILKRWFIAIRIPAYLLIGGLLVWSIAGRHSQDSLAQFKFARNSFYLMQILYLGLYTLISIAYGVIKRRDPASRVSFTLRGVAEGIGLWIGAALIYPLVRYLP